MRLRSSPATRAIFPQIHSAAQLQSAIATTCLHSGRQLSSEHAFARVFAESSPRRVKCRAFVNSTFAKCNDSNRAAVEAELKTLIYQAFEKGQLSTIDWSTVKLEA